MHRDERRTPVAAQRDVDGTHHPDRGGPDHQGGEDQRHGSSEPVIVAVETSIGHYNVTKAALIHLTKSLAKELAPGVRVNAVCPGLVKTDMARALWEPNEAAVARMVPLDRLGEVEDIARAVLFLSSDAASWITGTTLVVDGGMLL